MGRHIIVKNDVFVRAYGDFTFQASGIIKINSEYKKMNW